MDNVSSDWLLEDDRGRTVPGLHPGLNELIRVLGKQAHCASRTLILCEPHVPSKIKKTNFHKHCSPKRRNSSDSVSRAPVLWSPVTPDNYYYDCFNYAHYPERETDYQDIENRYMALKDKPLCYDSPVCDPKKIKKALENSDARHKRLRERLFDPQSNPSKTKGYDLADLIFSSSSIIPLLTLSEEARRHSSKLQVYSSQQASISETPIKYESGSNTITKKSGGESVPKSSPLQATNSKQQNLDEQLLMYGSNRSNTMKGGVDGGPQSLKKQGTSSRQQNQNESSTLPATNSKQQNLDEQLLTYGSNQSSTMKGGIDGGSRSLKKQGTSSRQQNLNESSQKPGGNYDRTTKGEEESRSHSVPCEELTNIRNLIKKSEQENFERMQQMLLLMKELSAKEFCRATCDQIGDRDDEMGFGKLNNRGGVTPSGEPSDNKVLGKDGSGILTDSSSTSIKSALNAGRNLPSSKSKSSTNLVSTASDSSIEEERISHLHESEEETSSEPEGEVPTESGSDESCDDSEEYRTKSDLVAARSKSSQKVQSGSESQITSKSKESMRSKESIRGAKSKDSVRDVKSKDSVRSTKSDAINQSPSVQENGQKGLLLNVCDSPMTVHELVEVSNIITDIVVLETVNELIEKGKYTTPSNRQDGEPTAEKQMISEGTRESPFGVKEIRSLKPILSDPTVKEKNKGIENLKTVSLPRASALESYKGPKPAQRSEELKVDSIGSKIDGATMKSKGSDASGSQSVKSKLSNQSKEQSLKSKDREGSLDSERNESLKASSKMSDGSKTSKVDSIGQKLDQASLRSKASEGSRTQYDKSKLSNLSKEQSLKSRDRDGSLDSRQNENLKTSSKMSDGSKVRPTGSKVDSSGSKVDSTKSKVDSSGLKVDSIGSNVDSTGLKVASIGSKADSTGSKGQASSISKISEASRTQSVKSKLGNETKTESTKSEKRRGSIISRTSDESRTQSTRPIMGERSLKPKKGELSKIESVKEEPGFESTRTMLAEQSKAESVRSKAETFTSSKVSDKSKDDPLKSNVSKDSKMITQKSMGYEKSNVESKSSLGSKPGISQSTPGSLKSIGGRPEPSQGRRVSQISEEIESSSTGPRRLSSCPKHSRSPSPSDDGNSMKRSETSAASSRMTQVSAEKERIKDMASSSSVRSQKDRRGRLSGEVTKLSTIDSVCEGDDSPVCSDYETDSSILYYSRMTENAFPPEKESFNAAGFVLKSAYDYTIPPRGKANVKTDLALELPPNSYGRIAVRRSLAVNFGIDVGADVIDRDYRENVTILLFNHSDKPFSIKKGNKVAQLICESIQQAAAKEKCVTY